MKIIGFVVMSSKKTAEIEYFAPMSYGHEDEPSPAMLLRRGRLSIFDSVREAEKALDVTLRQAKADGDKWPSKFVYSIIPVEAL